MSDASSTTESLTSSPRRPRLRFSLRGMFVFTLGVALAFAFRRVPNVGWADTILAACAGWISVGMLQEMRQVWLLWRANRDLPNEVQWGFALDCVRRVAAVVMITVAAGFELTRRLNPDRPDREFTFFWTLESLSSTLFFLGVVFAYWPKRRRRTAKPSAAKTFWEALLDGAAASLGALWLLYILASQTTITGLIHIAIRGVESAQPTRWLNQPFYPANLHLELTQQFVARSIVAAILITVAFGFTLLLGRCWNKRRMRIICIAVAALCSSCGALLAWWAWTVAYPTLSPFLAGQMHVQPPVNRLAGLTLILGSSLALVCRVVPKAVDENVAKSYQKRNEALHVTVPVMFMFLVGALGGSTPSWWDSSVWDMFGIAPSTPQSPVRYLSELIEFWTYEPKLAMRFAAILVVGWHLWRRWRRTDAHGEVLSAVNPAELFVVSALASIALLIVVPIAAWLGFVLVVYAPQLGL